MRRLRNTNPLGAVEIPALGLELTAGEEFDCPDDVAEQLLEQVGNYAPIVIGGKGKDD